MSLVAHWPLINNLNNLVDSSNPLTIPSDATYPQRVSSYGGSDYSPRFFDSYVNPNLDTTSRTQGSLISKRKLNLGRCQSMFCWVFVDEFYPFSTPSGESYSGLTAVCGQHRYHTGSGMGLTFRYLDSTHGYLSVNTGEGTQDKRTYNAYTSTTIIEAKKWYHVGFTFEEGYLSLYINGIRESLLWHSGESAIVCNSERYTDSVLANMHIIEDWFGAFFWSFGTSDLTNNQSHGNYKLTGMLNDIRVYNHALSPFEVHNLYKGLYCHYTFDPVIPGGVLRDNSGFCNDTTNHTITSADFSNPVRGRMSAVFNNTYVACPIECKLPAPLTYNLWAYMDDWHSYPDPAKTPAETSDYSMRLISCTESGGFNIECPAGKSTIQFSIFDKAYNNYRVLDTNIEWGSLSSGWHMFSAVITAGSYTVYIDATQIGSINLGADPVPGSGVKYNATNTLFIGCEAGPSASSPDTTRDTYYFTGKVGDFKLFASALTLADLEDEYRTRGLISSEGHTQVDTIIETNTGYSLNKTGILNTPTIVENEYIYLKGAKFLKIFAHDVRICKSYFSSKDIAKCYNQPGKFSRLNEIKDFYYEDNGGYEFLLTYPEISATAGAFKYNRWKQLTNPLTSSDIKGYEKVELHMQTNWGSGMRLSSAQALLDCNYGLSTWYGAIGQTAEWTTDKAFPSPAGETGYNAVELYIRVFDEEITTSLKEVPVEYQEIEYLEATGTQWIDTGSTVSLKTGAWEVKFQTSDVHGYYFILGVGYNEGPGCFRLYQYPDINGVAIYLYDIDNVQRKLEVCNGLSSNVMEVKYKAGIVYLNGTQVSTIIDSGGALGTLPNSANNVALFTTYGTSQWMTKGRIWSFKLWNRNDNLVQDLVPCIRTPDGVVGMYDTVTRNFIENAGSGAFIAGPLKADGQIFNDGHRMKIMYTNSFMEG